MISVCLPTRGRPDNMRELVESIADTAAGTVEVVFYIDGDDKASQNQAAKLWNAFDNVKAKAVIGERIVMSDTYNQCAKIAAGDILMECCDAVLFRSTRWDEAIEAEFAKWPDRLVLVYGQDGIHNGNAATLPFLHRRWLETVGYFMPPYFSCDWCDTWVHEVAVSLDRAVYLPQVVTEHRHPVVGTAPWDQTHAERIQRGEADHVAELYEEKAPERRANVEALRAAIIS